MMEAYYLITIVKKELGEQYIKFYQERGILAVFGAPAHGTAKQKTLDYLGIEKTEKAVLISMVYFSQLKQLMHELVTTMYIDIPDQGLVLAIPMECMSESLHLRYMKKEESNTQEGSKAMNDYHFSLIIAIVENGTTGMVMEAARKAGASGGTVLHVKGTHPQEQEKFFGISIASEKEMLFIACKSEQRSQIMDAIELNAGMASRAKTVQFAVPVEAVAGLRSLTVNENQIV